jgi:hypothetical protein
MLTSIKKDYDNTAAIRRFELLQVLHVRPREQPFIHRHAVFESAAISIMVIAALAGRVGWVWPPSESPRKLARAPLSSNTALRLPPLSLLQQWVLLASRTCLQAAAAARTWVMMGTWMSWRHYHRMFGAGEASGEPAE